MADRKETPDVLAELLGNQQVSATKESPIPLQVTSEKEIPEKATPKKVTRSPKRQTKASPKSSSRSSSPSSRRKTTGTDWEYQVVSFQYYNGWRLRYINGEEIVDWMESPLIHEYINQIGEQGWEMVAAGSGERMYGLSDSQQIYFKRLKG